VRKLQDWFKDKVKGYEESVFGSVADMIARIEKVTLEMAKHVYTYNGKQLPF